MLKQLGKGAAATGVAAVLAASISLGQAAPAEAFLPALFAPVLIGGTGLTLASTLGTTSLISGIGWGLASAGVLGAGAYSTRDWWMPIVNGAFGGQEPTPPTGETGSAPVSGPTISVATDSGQSYQVKDGWQSIYAIDGAYLHPAGVGFTATQRLNGADFSMTYTGTDYRTGTLYGMVYSMNCKRPDGTTYKESKLMGSSFGDGTYSAYPRTRVFSGFCQQSTHTVLGIVAGPVNGAPELKPTPSGTQYPGPINQQRWGDTIMPTADPGGFDPASPEVKYKTTVECVKPDGSLFEISADSTGADAGGQAVKFPSCDAASPGSHSTMKQKVESLAPGKTTWEPRWNMDSPPAPADQPLCDVRRPGQGCQLAVKLDGQLCTIGTWECANWTSLARDPSFTNRLSCQYGPYAVAVETCNPLERAYEEGGAPATEKNMDGNPDTRSDTMPNGQPQPKENTGTGSPSGTAPASGPGASTIPGGAATPSPGGSSEGCFPGGWAVFNPMWIVDGISCSFIPKMDITQRVGELQSLAGTKAPLSWMQPQMIGPGGGGCPAWWVNIQSTPFGPGYSKNVVCDSSFTAAIVGARGPLFGLVAGAMIWPLFRSLWYAAIPVLRVTPSSSK
jgi:hypothetical protein